MWHELGWDFNLENDHGKSCLFLCCRYNHPVAIETLHSLGIDILKKNKNGTHPLEYSILRGSFDCFDLLLGYYLPGFDKVNDHEARICDQFEQISKIF
jgi:ankyrin repeat protein